MTPTPEQRKRLGDLLEIFAGSYDMRTEGERVAGLLWSALETEILRSAAERLWGMLSEGDSK